MRSRIASGRVGSGRAVPSAASAHAAADGVGARRRRRSAAGRMVQGRPTRCQDGIARGGPRDRPFARWSVRPRAAAGHCRPRPRALSGSMAPSGDHAAYQSSSDRNAGTTGRRVPVDVDDDRPVRSSPMLLSMRRRWPSGDQAVGASHQGPSSSPIATSSSSPGSGCGCGGPSERPRRPGRHRGSRVRTGRRRSCSRRATRRSGCGPGHPASVRRGCGGSSRRHR